jgi:amidase
MRTLARLRRHTTALLAALVIGHCSLAIPAKLAAATFELSKAGIPEIQAAVDAGALTYEKLVQLYIARVNAYDQKGPALNSVILLNPKALEEARALDAEFKAKGRRSPLHGIPVIVKDNFDTFDMPNTGGAFYLEGSIVDKDAFMIRKLREAGAILFIKANLDELANSGLGFSSLGGQTRNPHDPTRIPGGSSGGTGAGLAAWFAPLGLGTDTGGSIRGPSSYNGVPGIKPTNGLLSRAGIIPRVLSFDTGGPMARTVYDVALSLGFMTGVDPDDELTRTSAGLFHHDYTVFLKKDALKGARLGIIRDNAGLDPEVDAILDKAVADLKAQGAVVIDDLHYPDHVLAARAGIMATIGDSDIREQYALYMATLKPGYPKTLTEMIERADALKAPKGKITPYPELYNKFKKSNAGPSSTSLAYRSARHGMDMVRDGVLSVFENHRLDAIVYLTRPKTAPPIAEIDKVKGSAIPSLTNIANITQFPDVIVPAGLTKEKLPVTISFLGPAYSEPRLLAYAYAYEQATHHFALPATTPALPGETITY